MSWEITAFYVGPAGDWAIKFTNVSGGTLSTDDFVFRGSITAFGGSGATEFSTDGSATVAAGDSFVYGDSDLAETDFGPSSLIGAGNLDFAGIAAASASTTIIDGIGNTNSGVAP